MTHKLFIVESPAKAKTINRMLGTDYKVMASMGHVRDLPEKRLGIDIEHGFRPEYVDVKSRAKTLSELRRAAAKSSHVLLAPDPDREGESIAWHLQEALRNVEPAPEFLRVTYNEITPSAVRNAVANPGRIDQHRVEAQQARRILDRLVGYKVSPLLWRQVERGLSAGRVQSVALRLVCEREAQIRDFTPREYWLLGARVRKCEDPLDPFEMRLLRIGDKKADVPDEKTAAAILDAVEGQPLRVAKVTVRETSRRAPPPYITSTLQQAGSSLYGFAPARSMRIAQSLYEGVDLGDGATGLITYMRTDSFNVAASARDQTREWILQTYGPEYLPGKPNLFANRGGAQAAHEAIRPTDVTRTPKDLESHLEPDQLKIYTAIWQRFVASQMAPARIAQRWADIGVVSRHDANQSYLFRAATSEIVFAGYMKVSGMQRTAKKEESLNEALPPLRDGEPLECLEWLKERKETQPPARFSEASLVRELEKNGVGRPSTYAQIVKTISDRGYVKRERKMLTPTPLGERVNTFLTTKLPELFNVGFTAEMEKRLDDIEEGEIEWDQMLERFWQHFSAWLEQAKPPPADAAKVNELLDIMEKVREWKPPRKIGRRTYDDKAFCESLRKQLAEEAKISPRQLTALAKVASRYMDQVPEVRNALAGMEGGKEIMEPPEPPRDATRRKLDLLLGIDLEPAAERGGRKYDDRAFLQSLAERIDGGRALTENQLRALNRIFVKYRDRIPEFERLREDLEVPHEAVADQADPDACRKLLDQLARVETWDAPAGKRGKRGKRDDRAFYESLREQFERKGSLSLRQHAALDKMTERYAKKAAARDAEAAESSES